MSNKSNFNSTSVNLNLKTYSVNSLSERTKLQDLSSNYQKQNYDVYDSKIYSDLQDEVLTLDELKEEARIRMEQERLRKEQEERERLERERLRKEQEERERLEQERLKAEQEKESKKWYEKAGDYFVTATASFATGALEVVENIGDGLLMAGGAVVSGTASLFGEDEFAEDVKNWTSDAVEYDWTEEMYGSIVDASGIDEEIAYGTVHKVASTAGTITGYVALTVATGGTGTAATVASVSTGALSAMGSSSEQALKSGATFEESLAVGTVAGVLGGVSGGALNKFQSANAGVKTASSFLKTGAKSTIAAISEPVLNSVTEYAVYGKDMVDENGENLGFFDYYKQSGGLLNTVMAGGIGFGSSMINFKFGKNIDNDTNVKAKNSLNDNIKPKSNVNSLYSLNKNTLEANILDIIKRHDAKYGTGDAVNRLNVFVDSNNSQYANYNIISNAYGARDILGMYTPEQIRHGLDNLSYKPNTHNISGFFYNGGAGSYGVDQGGIAALCVYEYDGKSYSYRQAMRSYNDALNHGIPPLEFVKKGNPEYFQLRDKLVSKGFSKRDASILMSTVDDAGACSYATVANEIFAAFEGRPNEFQQKFGYPMYKIENGKYVFNSNELLLDLYIECNRTSNGGGFILPDNTLNDVKLRNDRHDVLGRQLLDAENQVYLSNFQGEKNRAILGFLRGKGVDYKSTAIFKNPYGSGISDNQFNYIVQSVVNDINSGKNISLDIYQLTDGNGNFTSGQINMNSTNPNLYGSVSTRSWDEGGGHAIFVTGVGSDCFYVSSWGNEYSIPFADLKNGGSFNVYSSEISDWGGIYG